MAQLALALPLQDQPIALTVLSLGLGQESVAMLYATAHHPTFTHDFCPGQFLVLSCDTGDEHPSTNATQAQLTTWCHNHRIEYVHITPSMGYHSPSWPSLRDFYRTHQTIGSKSYVKSCSDSLKIQPFYKFLGHWLAHEYGVSSCRKDGFLEFRAHYGLIRVLIGFAKAEEARRADPSTAPKWRQRSVQMAYPLIDLGWTRTDCQQYIASLGYPVPSPSNCMLCPYMSKPELLWLARNHPTDFVDWIQLEAAKRTRFAHLGDKNFGVWGRKTLPMVLADAEREYAHLSNEELNRIKFSHGHSVKSKY